MKTLTPLLALAAALLLPPGLQPAWAQGTAQATAPAAEAPPALVVLDAQALARSAQRLRTQDAALQPSYQALLRRADNALAVPERSVTHKTTTPPSGDKHDYMSMGPYWWPNPATPNGLPYVRRDGQRNPQVAGEGMDVDRLYALLADVRDLALAYHFTHDPRYAHKTAAALRTWFLTPATRMNPHLRFGQAIPGIVDGRGIGLIDTRDLWWVIDAVALIAPSAALAPPELAALRQWFAAFSQWMQHSEPGREEAVANNNHGMFYDAQLAAYLVFTGERAQARQLVGDAQTKRLASQIARDGRLPLELERTRPFHYTVFTLEAANRLARIGQLLSPLDAKQPLDVWAFEREGRSLRAAIDFVAQTVVTPKGWTYATSVEPTPPLAIALPVLLQAQAAYGEARYRAAVQALQPLTRDDLAWLLWPTP